MDALKSRRKRKTKWVIVSPLRFVTMSVTVLVLLFLLLSQLQMSQAVVGESQKIITVEIASGDTMWSIARRYNYYNEDIRAVIYRIKRHNHMDSADIRAGESIEIPISKLK